jgi:hypothetical protein
MTFRVVLEYDPVAKIDLPEAAKLVEVTVG